MAKLKSTLPNMLLSLTGICLVAGAILAGVNQFTAGPIAVAKATALEEAIKAVAPEFDNKPTEDVYMAVSSDGDSLKIYPAKKGGQVVGGAVESNTKKGFSGEIRVIVGFDPEAGTCGDDYGQRSRSRQHEPLAGDEGRHDFCPKRQGNQPQQRGVHDVGRCDQWSKCPLARPV